MLSALRRILISGNSYSQEALNLGRLAIHSLNACEKTLEHLSCGIRTDALAQFPVYNEQKVKIGYYKGTVHCTNGNVCKFYVSVFFIKAYMQPVSS
jgi:hypothetical protein